MKTKLVLVIIFTVVVGITSMACHTTGGGWFIDESTQNKVTFGFSALITRDLPDAKGQFQLIDHGTKTRVHGTFTLLSDATGYPTEMEYSGTCFIDGDNVAHDMVVYFKDMGEPGWDAGDYLAVEIDSVLAYSGYLERGNIHILEPSGSGGG